MRIEEICHEHEEAAEKKYEEEKKKKINKDEVQKLLRKASMMPGN